MQCFIIDVCYNISIVGAVCQVSENTFYNSFYHTYYIYSQELMFPIHILLKRALVSPYPHSLGGEVLISSIPTSHHQIT